MKVSDNKKSMMAEVKEDFAISISDLQLMVADFQLEMRRGLNGEPGSLKMLPAFVDFPSGKEKGRFIALDLGGTNFRILLVSLQGSGRVIIEQSSKYAIPITVMQGTGIGLFDFIAKSIQRFFIDYTIESDQISLGFTFSFPVNQTGINSGVLVNWTKGFSATAVVGKDVVRMLADALKRCNLDNVKITALANDTVGTLMARSYDVENCDVGVIFGTGTNGCYRELTDNIAKISRLQNTSDHMIVNIEWGNFNCLSTNCYDDILDKSSNNPQQQQMEKMISGMYLGEIAHLVLINLVENSVVLPDKLAEVMGADLLTRNISEFEGDNSRELETIKIWLDGVGVSDSTVDERRCIQQICGYISKRAARISAAAIFAVVTWMDTRLEFQHTIAIDGTLYSKYPDFKQTISKTLQELHSGSGSKINLVQSLDGSGVGAAITSAVAIQQG